MAYPHWHPATAYGIGGFMGIFLQQGAIHPLPAIVIGALVINPSPIRWLHRKTCRPVWDALRCRLGILTREEVRRLDEDLDDWFAGRIKEQMVPVRKWTEVGRMMTQRFAVASMFNGVATFGPEASRAYNKVIMKMAKELDLAVDNAWTQVPSAEIIRRASTLGGTGAAQNG